MSSSSGEDHGSTPAAWTAVFLCIIGFLIGGAGLVFAVPAAAIVGGGIAVISPIVGKAMSAMGLGAVAK
ncbi:putative membrane-bound spermidine synthase [Catenulispora sp. MAP12-49]|uniref:HGxxPAAW family protein n=1 Tax=unclassified Catenulispora TaxID=414885 RepID=UPI003515D88C